MPAQDAHNNKISSRRNSKALSRRKVMDARVMGGGLWLLGMLALLVVPLISMDVNASVTVTSVHYSHSGNWKTVTDPSGKYSAVVREMVPGPKFGP